MLHWLILQIELTIQQVRTDVTIPRILAGVCMYAAVHATYRFIKNRKRSLEYKLQSGRHKGAYYHSKKRHKGRFSSCGECQAILVLVQESQPFE